MGVAPTLTTLLRRQSAPTVAAFVAALYAARGAETSVDGAVAVVDGQRVLVVPAGVRGQVRARLSPPAENVNRVMAVDPAVATTIERRYDVPVMVPADVDDLARYGLDRESANGLYQDFVGYAIEEVALPERTRPVTSERVSAGESGRRLPTTAGLATVVAVVILATVVLAVPGVVGLGMFGVEDTARSTGAPTSTGGGAGADEAGVANEPRPTAREEGDETDPRIALAPGLTTNGVSDSTELGGAHASVLATRSYTWELTYTESTNGTETGVATERVTVDNGSVWASNVTYDGFFSTVGPIGSSPSYADGSRRYEPTTNGFESAELSDYGDVGRQEWRAQRYVSVLVDGERTSVSRTILGAPRLYVVNVEGAGVVSIQNYTATAHVAPDGLVTYYAGSWCLTPFGRDDGRRICVSLTMRYLNVSSTVVEPPAWFQAQQERCSNLPRYCGDDTATRTPLTATNTTATDATPTNTTATRTSTPTA